jgi:hypothetical protein
MPRSVLSSVKERLAATYCHRTSRRSESPEADRGAERKRGA